MCRCLLFKDQQRKYKRVAQCESNVYRERAGASKATVVERIIEIVKVIGKRGLSYRGDKSEAAYTLENDAAYHGTFLELVLLLSKFDICMQTHVNSCIENSKRLHNSGAKGRGSLVTLLSKTTVNTVIEAIGRLIKENIAAEVKEAGMYSIHIDTTQDTTTKDQCSVIIRYVTDVKIQERMIALVNCESSTGQAFVDLLKSVLEKIGLNIVDCVGNSTDGAANMQGEYKGFSALLSAHSPQVYVWCYGHVLNLVIMDTTGSVLSSASLFSLLNDITVFLGDSYQRMNAWEDVSKDVPHRKLSPIGETRWWAKDAALTKMFGKFGDAKGCLYIDLVVTLKALSDKDNVKPTVRAKADAYAEALLKYQTKPHCPDIFTHLPANNSTFQVFAN